LCDVCESEASLDGGDLLHGVIETVFAELLMFDVFKLLALFACGVFVIR
jgi:hypothetical protein